MNVTTTTTTTIHCGTKDINVSFVSFLTNRVQNAALITIYKMRREIYARMFNRQATPKFLKMTKLGELKECWTLFFFDVFGLVQIPMTFGAF